MSDSFSYFLKAVRRSQNLLLQIAICGSTKPWLDLLNCFLPLTYGHPSITFEGRALPRQVGRSREVNQEQAGSRRSLAMSSLPRGVASSPNHLSQLTWQPQDSSQSYQCAGDWWWVWAGKQFSQWSDAPWSQVHGSILGILWEKGEWNLWRILGISLKWRERGASTWRKSKAECQSSSQASWDESRVLVQVGT